MARIRLNSESLTGTALVFVDNAGYEALTVSAVAGELEVAPSAIYTHCDGLDGLRCLVAVAATNNLASQVRTAAIGTAGESALIAMGHAYRRFAHDHPGQFAAILRPPRTVDDAWHLASQSVVDVFALVFSAMGLAPQESALAARSTHCAIHGFLALEHASGTSDRHDDEYRHLLETLQRGLWPSGFPTA